jgi:hypothetical protein
MAANFVFELWSSATNASSSAFLMGMDAKYSKNLMKLEVDSLALPATSQQGDSYRPIGLPNIDIYQASKRRLSRTELRARVLRVCRQFSIITAAISTDATSPEWRRKQLAWPPKPPFPRPTTARESPFTTNCASRSEWSTRPLYSPSSRRCSQLFRSIAAWSVGG